MYKRQGQTRTDLAGVNAGILRSLVPSLLERSPDAVFVIVTNPADVMAVVAQEVSGLPRERVFSSGTVLDTSRLRWKLAQRAGVSISSVHAYIVGEHGDTEFPLWSHATIGSVPILDWQPLDGQPKFTVDELDQIAIDVRDAAYKVIQGKGATNYAIGLSGARIVEAILEDEHAVMPVSTVLEDFHGVSGMALSVPCVVSAAGAVPIRETSFSEHELELFHRSAEALRQVADSIR